MTNCYLECYANTVGKMSPAQLSVPWGKAFESEELGDGGCPVVHKICDDGSTRTGCPAQGVLVEAHAAATVE